jgi:hypothetical protein
MLKKNTKKVDKTPVGELRPSQMLYTYGVGAIIDLPRIAAMVMGLDDWDIIYSTEVVEERLLAAVRAELGESVTSLRTPPLVKDTLATSVSAAFIGVPVAAFPRWLICPRCRYLGPISDTNPLVELSVSPYRPDRTCYVHAGCSKMYKNSKPPEMVPVRFLVACKHGHLDDFPWHWYVHKGPSPCKGQLFLYEYGFGEVSEITVKCATCEASRKMVDAFDLGGEMLPDCTARRPHLRDRESQCTEKAQVILLGASNSWFPLTQSTLYIPTQSNKLGELLETYWGTLQDIATKEVFAYASKRGELPYFSEFSTDIVWQAVEERRSTAGTPITNPTDIKTPEWDIFSQGTAPPSRDLHLTPTDPPVGYEDFFHKVVLVEKLRSVQALTGFTRIASPGEFAEISELPQEQRVPLSRQSPTWVPATEVRGEGIFLEFNIEALNQWAEQPAIKKREELFLSAHKKWRESRGLPPEQYFPGIGYVLIHSLSHALMRQLSLECGYNAASIRERIYWTGVDGTTKTMAGLLLYTSAPDSEGTLGGLVAMGHPKRLGNHLDQAFEMMRLCASDPLCAEGVPMRDGNTLSAAACHACLFAPETSCERSNKYLDRALLVETTENSDLALFFTP